MAAVSSCPKLWRRRSALEETAHRQDRRHPEDRGIVWDLGANTGEFSLIAASRGSFVVSIDADPACTDYLYNRLKGDLRGMSILPLTMDLANPTPALGWNEKERHGLRARGPADLVMALALIHHLVFSYNIPLPSIAEWLDTIGDHLAIEFVSADDPMVSHLLKARGDEHLPYSQGLFESSFARYFSVLEKTELTPSRSLYVFARKGGSFAASRAAIAKIEGSTRRLYLLIASPVIAVFFIIPLQLFYDGRGYVNWSRLIPAGFVLAGFCLYFLLAQLCGFCLKTVRNGPTYSRQPCSGSAFTCFCPPSLSRRRSRRSTDALFQQSAAESYGRTGGVVLLGGRRGFSSEIAPASGIGILTIAFLLILSLIFGAVVAAPRHSAAHVVNARRHTAVSGDISHGVAYGDTRQRLSHRP